MLNQRKTFACFLIALLLISDNLLAGAANSGFSEMITKIQVYKGNTDISIDSLSRLPSSSFKNYDNGLLDASQAYWIKITIQNPNKTGDNYFIHFNDHIEEIRLFQGGEDKSWIENKSGVTIPERQKTVGGMLRDKVPFSISNGSNTVLYLKVENHLKKTIDISKIKIIDADSYYKLYYSTKQIQSFFLGIVAILCFLNLLLFIFTKTRIHLYYSIYTFISSIYFIHYFHSFKTFFFDNTPAINIYFFFSLTIGQVVYCWFLYESVKNEDIQYFKKLIFKYTTIISYIVIFILIISVFNFKKGILLSDIFSVSNSVFIFLAIFFLFRKVSNTVKIILIGSVFLAISGFIALLTNTQDDSLISIYIYQSGFFIELIFFTIAINFMLYKERLAKTETELKNSLLINEKLIKEKEAQMLREELFLKERDLTTKTIAISQKEELIKNVITQLKKQIENNPVKTKDIKELISDLNSKININLWDEFENHFIKVHPDFYKMLNAQYPALTPNERRLCAFLKLNLTTKEISEITKRTPESLHVIRYRLRKKMGLKQNDTLENIIARIQ